MTDALTTDQIVNLDALNMVAAFVGDDLDGFNETLVLYDDCEKKVELIGALALIAACFAAPPVAGASTEDRLAMATHLIGHFRSMVLNDDGT